MSPRNAEVPPFAETAKDGAPSGLNRPQRKADQKTPPGCRRYEDTELGGALEDAGGAHSAAHAHRD